MKGIPTLKTTEPPPIRKLTPAQAAVADRYIMHRLLQHPREPSHFVDIEEQRLEALREAEIISLERLYGRTTYVITAKGHSTLSRTEGKRA